MQRLRTTFKRSRTPTGAEMKTQSSLEVPKQIRSASFDEIQLEAKRQQTAAAAAAAAASSSAQSSSDSQTLLKVPPQYDQQRSRSVDSGTVSEEGCAAAYLEVPSRRFQRRRSSGGKTTICVHCACVEEYNRLNPTEEPPPLPPRLPGQYQQHHPPPLHSDSSGDQRQSSYFSDLGSDSSSDEDDDDDDDEEGDGDDERGGDSSSKEQTTDYSRENSGTDYSRENSDDPPEFRLTITLSPTLPSPPPLLHSPPPMPSSPIIEFFPPEPDTDGPPITPTQNRRKSIHRQEAFFAEPTGTSLENMSEVVSEPFSETSEGALSEGDAINTTIPGGLVVRDIYLQVPDLKRDRAASVDSCFSKVSEKKTEELQHSGVSLEVPVGPNVALRSRSVDIVLPTDEQARYKALAMAAPAGTNAGPRKSITNERALRSTPDWCETAVNGEHLWVPTSVSGDFCYVGDPDCTKHGSRMKCSSCNIIAHQSCIPILINRHRFMCKPTFRDVGVRQYREQTTIQHHWVHRRSEKGKCRHCGKSFQSKLSFSSKEIVAICCSWCKTAYHNKETCFNVQRVGEECHLGVHSSIIVPPSWIVKLPKKGSFKSSLRKTPKKRPSSKKKCRDKDKEQKAFVIKPIPSTNVTPVIVFINPKSGGNQGLKLLQKFQWLLNPRQVFDLTQGGPKSGLELFKKVPNLRVLACGGDGTVGWVLSVIDQIGMNPVPAVGVLPLGTGNDLARALGWGGGYTDEPISKILSNISHSDTVLLDRWSLEVQPNVDAENAGKEGKENLPLNVVNNYYSLGVDAHIALEFHEAREAHPEKFNSRLRNKMFYGQMGGKDLLKRKWKGLADFVTLECDGQDITPKLKELRVHAIVFLNIGSYGGGTKPWNRSMGSSDPSTEDGLIEVLGLTTYQLPLLQAGGHGTCITQCRSAKIVTSKTIPMQVDGEACKLKPSIITLTHLNKATMLAKRKCGKVIAPQTPLENIKIIVYKISMSDYEQHHYEKDLLTQAATNIGTIEVNPTADLEQVRAIVNKLLDENKVERGISAEWCFVDSCTAERFFRVDRAQENLHYVVDVASEDLYILECGGSTSPHTPDDGGGGSDGKGGRKGGGGGGGGGGRGGGPDVIPSSPKHQQQQTTTSSSSSTTHIIPEMRISDEGSLDSPSDHPPMSPRMLQSPDGDGHQSGGDNKDNGSDSESGIRIRSITERLFSLTQESFNTFSNVEQRPNEDLIKAAKSGDLQALRNLHGQGLSLQAKDATGQTLLHYAARYGHKDVVKYLISYAPSIVNHKEHNLSQTALHMAAACGWRHVCCMLVAGGAILDLTDYRGNTARMLAMQAHDPDLAAYLESQENFQMVATDLGTAV